MILNIFDFDDTLYRIPPHTAAPKDFDISGDVHKWYDHPESLDFTKHRVQLIENIALEVMKSHGTLGAHTVLITRRIPEMAASILRVLGRDGIFFNKHYLIGHGPKSAKVDVLAKILSDELHDQTVKEINIYEDSLFQIMQYVEFFENLHYPVRIAVRYFFVDKTHVIQLHSPKGETLSQLQLKDC